MESFIFFSPRPQRPGPDGNRAAQTARQGAVLGQFHDPADVADEDMIGVHPHLPGQLAWVWRHPLLPMDGDEELGPDQGVDNFQLLLAGVARHVKGASFSLSTSASLR